MAKRYEVKLLKKEKLAENTWLFAFEKPQGYIFTSGQYQTFTLSLPNGKVESRNMTITSSPKQNELWMVTKNTEHSSLFKKTLMELAIGSTVLLEGPSGGFTIRDKKKLHIFLAGGIGINVFHSMIRGVEEESLNTQITLFASFRKKQDLLYYEELKKLETKNKKIIYTLTQEDWEEEKGRISEKMIRKYVPQFEKSIFMIAGSQDFVDGMYELLVQMKIAPGNIKLDYFTGY